MNENRLVRREEDSVFLGVAGGLAQYMNVDPVWVRFTLVMLFLGSVGGVIPAYFVLALVMPKVNYSQGAYKPFSEEEIIIKNAV